MSEASGSGSAQQRFSGARSVARKLALQALYRWQLNDCPWPGSWAPVRRSRRASPP